MRRLLLVLLSLLPFASAQDPYEDPSQEKKEPGKPAAEDPSKAEYEKCLERLKRKRWVAAQRAFRKFIKKHPDSPYVQDAMNRSDDNCYLGTEVLWQSGPPEKRIDVAVMGDGFTNETSLQNKQEKWARLCVDVLWNEPSFDSYRRYFNIYFVRLASLEEGVDPQLTPEQRAKIEEKNRYRSKSRQKKTDYSTAIDAKAAGPQGQVMCSRTLVYKWLDIANRDVPGVGDDRYVIAFAQFGRLGMGGGGIANVGRPDKSITTHEFGHAFSRLLDEYAINPGPPRAGMFTQTLLSPNTYPSEKEPKPEEVPWAHMLKKRVKGVGIYEGGATFKKGVWRPAASCAMNAAGATGFCPVCREQTIKVIYEYVNPIEHAAPNPARAIEITEGDERFLSVTPMQPKHKLKVSWYVVDVAITKSERSLEPVPAPVAPPPIDLPGVRPREPEEKQTREPEEPPEAEEDPFPVAPKRPRGMFAFGGWRGRGDRSMFNRPPPGKLSRLGKVEKGKPPRHVFPLGKLEPGNWKITCEVHDPTKWVIKDENHLLSERVAWRVKVNPKPEKTPTK